MKKGHIYAIKNLVTEKFYVGQTINLKRRRRQHFKNLQRGVHKGTKLLRSYNVHGEVFVFGVIESVSREKLNERETYWIKKFDSVDNGYNCDYGGANPVNPDRCKAVRAFETDGVTYTDYPSVIEASRVEGVDRAHLHCSLRQGYCCIGKKWFYLDKDCPEKIEPFTPIGSQNGYRVFDYSGKSVGEFDTLREACEVLGTNYSAARQAVGKDVRSYGYKYFRITDTTPTEIPPFRARKRKKTAKYKKIKSTNIKTKEVKYYNTVKEASEELKVHESNITRACNGDLNTCRGCAWEYIQ